MKRSSWRTPTILAAALLFGACTNGGKNLRDTTGMTPGAAPAAAGDSITSRRDTLGGRMSRMMPRTGRDSMHRTMRDTTRRP